MASEFCVLCGKPEKGYTLEPDTDLLCGSCVQRLLLADKEDLKRAHKKALELGYKSKVWAIENFLIPEEVEDGKRPTKSARRNFNRKRATRTIRRQTIPA